MLGVTAPIHGKSTVYMAKNRVNCTKGGDGYLGYVPTPEAIEKIKAANTGRPGFWKGKKIPAHVVKAMREGSRNMPEESRQRIKDGLELNYQKIRKPIICVNDGRRFSCAREAAQAYRIADSVIFAVCQKNGKNYTAGGYVFRFEGDADLALPSEQIIAVAQTASKRRSQKPRGMKKVVCLKTGAVFDSVKMAAASLGVSDNTIIHMCKGRNKHKAYSGVSVSYYQGAPNG